MNAVVIKSWGQPYSGLMTVLLQWLRMWRNLKSRPRLTWHCRGFVKKGSLNCHLKDFCLY